MAVGTAGEQGTNTSEIWIDSGGKRLTPAQEWDRLK